MVIDSPAYKKAIQRLWTRQSYSICAGRGTQPHHWPHRADGTGICYRAALPPVPQNGQEYGAG